MDSIVSWITNNQALINGYVVNIAGALLILVVGIIAARLISSGVHKMLVKRGLDSTIVDFASNILCYALIAFVVVAALGRIGVQTTSFIAILGAAGLAVGLALKDSLSNFSSGVMIVVFKPFKIGDVVDVGGTVGKVTEITIFNTVLTSGDNQKFIVPNSNVMGSTIQNITANISIAS